MSENEKELIYLNMYKYIQKELHKSLSEKEYCNLINSLYLILFNGIKDSDDN